MQWMWCQPRTWCHVRAVVEWRGWCWWIAVVSVAAAVAPAASGAVEGDVLGRLAFVLTKQNGGQLCGDNKSKCVSTLVHRVVWAVHVRNEQAMLLYGGHSPVVLTDSQHWWCWMWVEGCE